MKRILPVLLIVCLLLCACAQNGPEQTTAPVTTAAVTEAPTTEPPTTEPPTTEQAPPAEDAPTGDANCADSGKEGSSLSTGAVVSIAAGVGGLSGAAGGGLTYLLIQSNARKKKEQTEE